MKIFASNTTSTRQTKSINVRCAHTSTCNRKSQTTNNTAIVKLTNYKMRLIGIKMKNTKAKFSRNDSSLKSSRFSGGNKFVLGRRRVAGSGFGWTNLADAIALCHSTTNHFRLRKCSFIQVATCQPALSDIADSEINFYWKFLKVFRIYYLP